MLRVYETASCEIDVQGVRERKRESGGAEGYRGDGREEGGRTFFLYTHLTLLHSKA